jgi:hypothetical protein
MPHWQRHPHLPPTVRGSQLGGRQALLQVHRATRRPELPTSGLFAVAGAMIDSVSDESQLYGPAVLSHLAEVQHVMSGRSSEDWLVAAEFRFDEGYLSVEVDPSDDTVDVSFDPARQPTLRHWANGAVRHDANERYADVLGLGSAWRWVLRNQQGYQDGFQIELGYAFLPVTFQYVAMASRLCRYNVIEAVKLD